MPVTLADLGTELGLDMRIPLVDVTSSRFRGGAKGDGVTDDTGAFQDAINYAIANGYMLFLPVPKSSYVITSQLTIQSFNPQPAFVSLNMFSVPFAGPTIIYNGPNNTSCFRSLHWAYSRVVGINVKIGTNATGVTCWDMDCTTGSSSHVTFDNCAIDVSLAGINCNGWRMGHLATGGAMDEMEWRCCSANGNTLGAVTGQNGWVNEHANGLQYSWFDSVSNYLDRMFTNQSTAGANSTSGGSSMWFHSPGGSFNTVDFEFSTAGGYAIEKGRFESGSTFVKVIGGSTKAVIGVSDVMLSTYAVGKVFDISAGRPVDLEIRNLYAYGTDHTSAFITATGSAGQIGRLKVHGSVRAADPFYAVSGDPWIVDVDVRKMNSSNQPTASMGQFSKALTYSASITPEATYGMFAPLRLTVTNGTAFTINAPTNPTKNQVLTFDILNSSGGVMGAITWNAIYKMDATGFVVPASTKRKTISFCYDGTNWNQTAPTTGDI